MVNIYYGYVIKGPLWLWCQIDSSMSHCMEMMAMSALLTQNVPEACHMSGNLYV